MCFGHKQHVPKGSLSKKRYYKDAKMTYRTPGQVHQGTGSENSLCFSSPKRYALFFYKLVVFAPRSHVRKWLPTSLRCVSSPFKTPARWSREFLYTNEDVPWGKNPYCSREDPVSTPDPLNCGKGTESHQAKCRARDTHETEWGLGMVGSQPTETQFWRDVQP